MSTRHIIADAVSRFPLQTSAEWASRHPGMDIERIDTASISTLDCLFEGECQIVVKGNQTPIPAHVYGRFDGRRAEVERFVLDA